MEEILKKSEQKIKELNKIVTAKEWNKIAKKEGLLMSRTISYITKTPFVKYCSQIRKG